MAYANKECNTQIIFAIRCDPGIRCQNFYADHSATGDYTYKFINYIISHIYVYNMYKDICQYSAYILVLHVNSNHCSSFWPEYTMEKWIDPCEFARNGIAFFFSGSYIRNERTRLWLRKNQKERLIFSYRLRKYSYINIFRLDHAWSENNRWLLNICIWLCIAWFQRVRQCSF